MKIHNNEKAFFALVRSGLWNKEVQLAHLVKLDFCEIYRLAIEQSVLGLVTAGIDNVQDIKVPHEAAFQFIGASLQLEKKNSEMNMFISELIQKMRSADVYALLVKGQGIAQYYEKPLLRACGDIDLFLNKENYSKAKIILSPIASHVEQERGTHLGLSIDGWVVELHGSLHCGLSSRIDGVLDNIRDDTFYNGNVRTWRNGGTDIFMLAVENDILFVFTHFLKHFYKEGLGIRQICDWCRLLWHYRSNMNLNVLVSRIKQMGLVSEWRAFGTYAVTYLGMPVDAMPLYSPAKKWQKKANRINKFIMSVGNMGHNRDMSHFKKYPFLIRKCISAGRRMGDLINHARIFPVDSLRFSTKILFDGLRLAARGKG